MYYKKLLRMDNVPLKGKMKVLRRVDAYVEEIPDGLVLHLDVELLDQVPALVQGQAPVLVLVSLLELLLEESGPWQ